MFKMSGDGEGLFVWAHLLKNGMNVLSWDEAEEQDGK